MKLRFLGTRGQIEARSRRHRRHSALLVLGGGRRIVVDWGEDWTGRFDEVRPHAVVLTHAHADHAAGLEHGAPCPVYATATTWEILDRYPIEHARVIEPRKPLAIHGVKFEAFVLEHSMRRPAVAYRITADRKAVVYAPDVAALCEQSAALGGIELYIGDGASITRPIVKRQGRHRIGHASIREQLAWCAEEGVRRCLFTHCGSQIVEGDERRLGPQIRRMGREHGIEARLAHDGMTITIP